MIEQMQFDADSTWNTIAVFWIDPDRTADNVHGWAHGWMMAVNELATPMRFALRETMYSFLQDRRLYVPVTERSGIDGTLTVDWAMESFHGVEFDAGDPLPTEDLSMEQVVMAETMLRRARELSTREWSRIPRAKRDRLFGRRRS